MCYYVTRKMLLDVSREAVIWCKCKKYKCKCVYIYRFLNIIKTIINYNYWRFISVELTGYIGIHIQFTNKYFTFLFISNSVFNANIK